MGCRHSKVCGEYIDEKDVQNFSQLGLGKLRIRQYLKAFKKYDPKGNMCINLTDFLKDNEIEFNYLVIKIFHIEGLQHYTAIRFREVSMLFS